MSATNFIQINESYGQPIVSIDSNGQEVIVISDLHLSSGLQPNLNYDGTENFYADDSLGRFLQFIAARQQSKPTILIINGDFVDFIRIRNYPTTSAEFTEWKDCLGLVGITKTYVELQSSISKKEKDFGLGTDDYKSIWKLHKSAHGHPILFQQLALWLANGNELYITKGNHDLEWYWKPVRDYLQHLLQHAFAPKAAPAAASIKLGFADDALVVDGKIHIVHGHVFDNMTNVKGEPTVNSGTQLNLPFGSFFNRYLINRLELAYPFLDNIRPSQKILPLLIRERFPLALKVLFYYVPFVVLVIPKKVYRETLKYVFDFLLIIVLPVAIAGFAIYKNVQLPDTTKVSSSFIGNQIINLFKSLSPLVLSYFLARLMSMFRLSSPNTFFSFAQNIYNNNPAIQTVVFGHTHNPEQCMENDRWYFNTGTWIPVYDLSMADVRLDKTYTYLHIIPGSSKAIELQLLLRWNDDAARPEPMVLRELK